MKKITRLLLLAAISIGMVACSNDDVPQTPESLRGSTYASIAVTLPKAPSTRTLPDDYNKIGTWEGIDAIETITVFLVNKTLGTIDHSTFNKDTFTGITGSGTLKPTLAVKATPGESVKAYVVLNGESDVLDDLKAATPSTFNTVYTTAFAKNASVLAKNEAGKDVIMMTNTELPTAANNGAITIKPNITKDKALEGTDNYIKVKVERVVSRAIATVKAGPHSIDVLDAMKTAGSGSIITIQSVNYVVGQSNKKFFLTKKADWETPADVYGHVPSVDTWNPELFDNTGLGVSAKVLVSNGAEDLKSDLTGTNPLLKEGTDSKFVLPVTHETGKYEKGNTTYFEVIAIFTPDKVDGGDYTAGADVFLGMNDGKFYSKRADAEAEGQKATHYKGDGTTGAIMKYVLWLNPDVIPGTPDKKAKLSPTVRNQVYHAHITGFKQIGLPNNPLNPTDPEIPENPINPIKPEDPLQTDDTYLSVQITVVPWGIHSYEINLGNDY